MTFVEPGSAEPRRPHAATLPVLEADAIRLGPWLAETADADAEALARLHADATAMRYWSTEPWVPGDRARAEAYLDAIDDGAKEGDLRQFAARLPGSSALVGWVTLYRIDRTHRRTAGDAEDVGVGERIAQEKLEQGAGEGQEGADGEGR
jgi:RimJ/RimL family protein N-acetyltransferase